MLIKPEHLLYFLCNPHGSYVNFAALYLYGVGFYIIILPLTTPSRFQAVGKAMIWTNQFTIFAPATCKVFTGMWAPCAQCKNLLLIPNQANAFTAHLYLFDKWLPGILYAAYFMPLHLP